MQLFLILLCIAVFCLWNSQSDDDRERDMMKKRSRRDTDQIERLKARVNVLEEILLDRDRQLRDRFGGI